MTLNHWRKNMIVAAIISATMPAAAAFADANTDAAKAYVADVAKANPPWTGPKDGPAAQKGKLIVYVSADQRNGGALGVSQGVQEAVEAIGWELRILDGQGTVSGRSTAMQQAIALKPDGIVLGTVDAQEQAELIKQADAAGVKVVGWHSTTQPGPSAEYKLFANITTDPLDVAKAAASFAVAESDGKAGVVIFTDSTYAIAIAKSDAMAEVIKACGGCKLLETQDTPLAEASTRMPQLTTSLLQRYGEEWTYSLSINDLTFDFMSAELANVGITEDGYPRNISAGDGSEVAFLRIRSKQYQSATVAEPLLLHGWQAVDELNRAFADQPASMFSAPVHLVTTANIESDGGPKNMFDPDNGYRDAYKTIWAGK